MGCPKNPKTMLFGLISYEGAHDWKPTHIGYMQWWTVGVTCQRCKARDEWWPLHDEDMIREGYDIEKLHAATGWKGSVYNPEEFLEC
jgi:hypothetical protein